MYLRSSRQESIYRIQNGAQKWVYSRECAQQFILGLLLINHCITFHVNNGKPAFARPRVHSRAPSV